MVHLELASNINEMKLPFALSSFYLQDVRTTNVDGYQGRENDIVVLSLVRSNTSDDIGFARVPNRLNVAISRARELLIIFGNIGMFRRHKGQLWKTFIRLVDESAVFIPEA
jgi:superfamily I DNA and/or RNA helicase